MATQKRLQELYEKGKQSCFTLPSGVTTKKTFFAEGYHIQIFNHESLGEIGRIIIFIESTVYPCEVCHEITSMVIYAHDAEMQGDLENYARQMYSKIKELNVSTWVVGREKEITLANSTKTGQGISMKIWPIRESLR